MAIRRADTELSPFNLALVRWFLASAGFLVVFPFFGKPKSKFDKRDLPRILIIALLNVPAYHLALNSAEVTVSAGVSGLLISLGPIFIAVLSVYFLKEKLSKMLIIAIVLGVVGTIVLSIPDFMSNSSMTILGSLEVIIAAGSFATFSVLSKPLVQKYGSAPVTIWAGLAGTLMLLPLLSPSFTFQIARLSLGGWVSVVYLSILSTVIGYLLFYSLVSQGALSKLSIQLYLIPIVSVIGGVLILQEGLNIYIILGGLILLASVALATVKKKTTEK